MPRTGTIEDSAPESYRMPTRDEHIKAVEDFLGDTKTIALGIESPVQWSHGRQSGEECVKIPLEVDGVQMGHQLVVVFVPGRNVFSISVVYSSNCVFRLDWDEQGGHTNGFVAHLDGLPAMIGGLHLHRWNHNSRFFDPSKPTQELKHAEELPRSVRNFDDALRYFCDETNINLPSGHYIELPRRLI